MCNSKDQDSVSVSLVTLGKAWNETGFRVLYKQTNQKKRIPKLETASVDEYSIKTMDYLNLELT